MPPGNTTVPSRAPIDQIREAVFTPLAVRAAMQLDLFTPLADGPMTASALADALGVRPRRLEMLLYQLVSAAFLELHGERFANTPVTDYYLVKGRPTYIGGIHGVLTEQFTAQLHTADSIRADAPQAKIDFAGMSPDQLGGFLKGLHGTTVAAGRLLAEKPVFAEASRVVDVGGGSGGLPIALCEFHPHLEAALWELPAVIPIAREMIAEAGLADRIAVEACDVLDTPPAGRFDVAVARSFFQVLSATQCRTAMHNIAAALPSGGTLFAIGFVCDDTRLAPLNCVNINLFFLNVFDEGEAYTESQYRRWFQEAGFTDVVREPFMYGQSVMSARKI